MKTVLAAKSILAVEYLEWGSNESEGEKTQSPAEGMNW